MRLGELCVDVKVQAVDERRAELRGRIDGELGLERTGRGIVSEGSDD